MAGRGGDGAEAGAATETGMSLHSITDSSCSICSCIGARAERWGGGADAAGDDVSGGDDGGKLLTDGDPDVGVEEEEELTGEVTDRAR